MPARRKPVVCRVCGEWGYEEPDDPCPGLCPACLARALSATLAETWDDHDRGHTVRRCIERNAARLEGIGLTPAAVARFRRGAERALAGELAAERRGN